MKYRYKINKGKQIGIIAILIMAFICSCHDNVDDELKTKDGEFISIHIGTGSGTITRAQEKGEDWEDRIKSVRLVFYNGENPSSSQVQKVYDLDIKTNDTGDGIQGDDMYYSEDNSKFVTVGKELEKADYLLLVLINPTSVIRDKTAEGKSLTEVTNSLSDILPKEISENNHFLMTNAKGLTAIAAEDFKETPEEAQQAPVEIAVERTVAKVTLSLTDDLENITNPDDDVSDLTWDLDITNRFTFLTRKMAQKKDGDIEAPEDRDWENFYATDPNFDGFSDYSGGNEPERFANFFYYQDPLVSGNDNRITEPLPLVADEWQYCLENTMNKEEQYTDVITRVLLRCKYIPAYVKGQGEENYFIYGNKIILENSMKTYALGFTPPPDLYGLDEAIETAKQEGIDFENLTHSFEYMDLKYFREGINYYSIPLQHFSYDQGTGQEYGYYGVVRNNHYKVEVESIKGTGSPTVVTRDNKDPVLKYKIIQWVRDDLDFVFEI